MLAELSDRTDWQVSLKDEVKCYCKQVVRRGLERELKRVFSLLLLRDNLQNLLW